jgi:hypothetical protein
MKLLEVIRTPQTSDETFNAMVAWGKAMKKTTVAAKDTPGKLFLFNIRNCRNYLESHRESTLPNFFFVKPRFFPVFAIKLGRFI